MLTIIGTPWKMDYVKVPDLEHGNTSNAKSSIPTCCCSHFLAAHLLLTSHQSGVNQLEENSLQFVLSFWSHGNAQL